MKLPFFLAFKPSSRPKPAQTNQQIPLYEKIKNLDLPLQFEIDSASASFAAGHTQTDNMSYGLNHRLHSKDPLPDSKSSKGNLVKEERMKDNGNGSFFVGKEVSVIVGRNMGDKATTSKKLEVKIRVSDLAELGLTEKDTYLKKLKELKIRVARTDSKGDERRVDKGSREIETTDNGGVRINVEKVRDIGKRGVSWLKSQMSVTVSRRGKVVSEEDRHIRVTVTRRGRVVSEEGRHVRVTVTRRGKVVSEEGKVVSEEGRGSRRRLTIHVRYTYRGQQGVRRGKVVSEEGRGGGRRVAINVRHTYRPQQGVDSRG